MQEGWEPQPTRSSFTDDPDLQGDFRPAPGSVGDPNTTRIGLGTVIKALPLTRGYEVMVFGETVFAFLASGSSSLDGGQGPAEISTLLSGTAVVCAQLLDGPTYILGAAPTVLENMNLAYTDFMGPSTGTGVCEDIHQRELKDDFGAQNCGGGMPGDALPGDWGCITQLGGGILLSQFVTMMRASENCGVWAYHFDSLLRLHGYNLEEFTSCSERRVFNDEGEVHDVTFRAKYPWEALGLGEAGGAFQTKTGEWKDGDVTNPLEPRKADQTGLWRHQVYRGFLGDLEQEYIAKADPKFNGNPIAHSDNESNANYAGLLQIIKGTDGAYLMRSAKEIMFSKYALIPVPQQAAMPDDATNGDWRKNYRASDQFGDGPAHKEQLPYDWTLAASNPDLRQGALLDYLAYTFGWYHVANFTEHKKDWHLPEESDLADGNLLGGMRRAVIDKSKITSLKERFWAELPEIRTVDIDQKMKGVKYYESSACFGIQDDGSIILEDAWGSQIVMSRGNISFQPAGNILMRPGKQIVAWSPGDIILRAGRSVDITSSHKDVRIKAEGNMHILAGNGEDYGGILLESRASNPTHQYEGVWGTDVRSSGVVVKCNNSQFITWATDIYMSITQLDEREPNIFYLDADDGKSTIMAKCEKFLESVKDFHVLNFIDKSAATYFGNDATILDTEICVIRNGGLIAVDGPIVTNKFMGGKTVAYDGDSPTMLPGASGEIAEAIDRAKAAVDTAVENIYSAVQQADNQVRNTPMGPLSEDLQQVAGFSMRDEKQYKIEDDFKFRAARWQQFLGGEAPHTWTEPPIKTPGGPELYPHPGRKWQQPIYYEHTEPTNFDMDSGYAVARDSLSPEPPTSGLVAPEDGYKLFIDPEE